MGSDAPESIQRSEYHPRLRLVASSSPIAKCVFDPHALHGSPCWKGLRIACKFFLVETRISVRLTRLVILKKKPLGQTTVFLYKKKHYKKKISGKVKRRCPTDLNVAGIVVEKVSSMKPECCKDVTEFPCTEEEYPIQYIGSEGTKMLRAFCGGIHATG